MINLERPNDRILLQCSFWLVGTILLSWLPVFHRLTLGIWLKSIGVLVFQFLLITSNVKWFFPRYFLRGRRVQYFTLLSILTLLISFLFMPGPPRTLDGFMPPPRPHNFGQPTIIMRFGSVAFPTLLAVMISVLLEIWELAQEKSKENIKLANEKLTTELQFLKSQINPHFLFNALNNIYSLSILQSEKTPDSIARLSEMLRYVIYECEKPKVSLAKELDYIRGYLELFQLKKIQQLNIALSLPENVDGLKVPPMLFIPFIENALKHSYIEDTQNGWVNIQLRINNQGIHFQVSNSVPLNPTNKDELGGIGLQNVRRRLDILYPNTHQLMINQEKEQFNVSLTIRPNVELEWPNKPKQKIEKLEIKQQSWSDVL